MTISVWNNKSNTAITNYRIIFSIIIGLVFSFSAQLSYAQQGAGEKPAWKFLVSKDNVLSTVLQKEVIEFFTSNPEMVKEIYPFEQDCIAGIEREAKTCEEAVRWQLADFRDEISLRNRKAQVNARETQVNARETQVNARETQVNKQLEMTSRLRVVTAIWALNNIIRGVKNPPREALDALSNVKNPVLLGDIAYILRMDQLLASGSKIDKSDVDTLQRILLSRAKEALALYNAFPEEAKKLFINSYEVASQADRFVLR